MDVGDLAQGDGALAHVAELFVDRQLFVPADAQGLVVLPVPVMNVGDLAQGDGAGALITVKLRQGKRLLPQHGFSIRQLAQGFQQFGLFPNKPQAKWARDVLFQLLIQLGETAAPLCQR